MEDDFSIFHAGNFFPFDFHSVLKIYHFIFHFIPKFSCVFHTSIPKFFFNWRQRNALFVSSHVKVNVCELLLVSNHSQRCAYHYEDANYEMHCFASDLNIICKEFKDHLKGHSGRFWLKKFSAKP